jgi:membrane-bound serine protease (ClpP class)
MTGTPNGIGAGLIVLLVIIGIGAVALIVWVVRRVIRAHQAQAAAGREEMVGRTAVVRQTLNPKGTVFIEGEWWEAVSEEGRVKPGEEVVITKVEGLRVYVARKK